MSKRHSELLQLYNNTEVSYLIHYPNPNPKPSPNPYPNPDPNSYVNPLLIPIPRRAKNEYGKKHALCGAKLLHPWCVERLFWRTAF